MDPSAWLGLLDAGDYTVAREVMQRGVAALFVCAFLSTYHQFPALLGEKGLLPAPDLLERLNPRRAPSVFHVRHTPYSDRLLRTVCIIGMVLGASVVIGLPQMGPAWAPVLVFLTMWALYLSIVSIGQVFYGFGWESLLLEAGFLVGFLGSHAVAPPLLMLLFTRWLLVRVEFGAGMIKMRGDPAWRDLSAMDYHHQTQPMPGPLSRWAHLKPRWWHRGEALGSHIVQLGAPWLLFAPQPIASFAAVAIILSQLALVVTGNYAWLNWLTIIIAFSGISDPFLGWITGDGWPGWGWGTASDAAAPASPWWWILLTAVVFVWLCVLSWPALKNLFSSHQLMNASFNRWHLAGAYGAFGSMTRSRREMVIEGVEADDPSEEDWRPYEFKGKPGDVYRRARQFAPYHLRLDWMMWFLALGSGNERWFLRLLHKLLEGDRAVRRLLRTDPFHGRPPTMLRVRVFDYRYATREERRSTGLWWVRTELGTLGTVRQ